MNPQKNQGEAPNPLLRDLQAEVSSESAPLLQFMLRHAGLIAGGVILFLLVLACTGLWRWYDGNRNDEARQELARISLTMQGQERTAALEALAGKAPAAVRVPVLLAWAQSALENNAPAAAATAYAAVAAEDAGGSLGLAAGLGQAGSLLKAGKAGEALSLLQGLEARLPEGSPRLELRQLVAEAALAAGQQELAARTYLGLAGESQGLEKEYFAARAAALQQAVSNGQQPAQK
ncbi:MAG: hypothetical protein Q4F27_00535 [Desulfovibrionaceae bacterium]|nr:hypothetical protein [Desulfovibrionaceae bacterium]